MRFIELALMSLPGVLFAAWVMGARHAGFRTLAAAACGLAALGGVLFWMGNSQSFTGRYVPAQFRDGLVVSRQGS